MLWDQELSALAERKRTLVAETAQLRAELRDRASAVTRHLRWIEGLTRVGAYLRPALVLGAALVGYRGVARKSRLLGVVGAGLAVARTAWRFIRGRR